MDGSPLPLRYVAVMQAPGGTRLFCSDRYRDEWTSKIGYAETFGALYEAIEVARRHDGQAMEWNAARELATAT